MAANDYAGWAVLEWECAIKHPTAGAIEGAPFIKRHIIEVTDRSFDDFAAGGADRQLNRRLMGLP
jgi:ketosteroid isomerase-like protein